MKKKLVAIITAVLTISLLSGCGGDDRFAAFKTEMNEFCDNVVAIDNDINSIDPDADDAVDNLLEKLDSLDVLFQDFAKIDFPEEFDYLEPVAAEAGDYMTQAVAEYHEAFSNGSYNEYTALSAEDSYQRAYKRVNIIISFLHGEKPEGVNLEEN